MLSVLIGGHPECCHMLICFLFFLYRKQSQKLITALPRGVTKPFIFDFPFADSMEDFGLYISDNEVSVGSDVASDDDLVDDQFEEVVVYDDGNLHQENQFRFGGYDNEFVDEVLPSQKCPVCLLTMRDAVQTSVCGHRFCRDCLHGILR